MKWGKAEKLSYDVQPTATHPDEVEGIVQASGIQITTHAGYYI